MVLEGLNLSWCLKFPRGKGLKQETHYKSMQMQLEWQVQKIGRISVAIQVQ